GGAGRGVEAALPGLARGGVEGAVEEADPATADGDEVVDRLRDAAGGVGGDGVDAVGRQGAADDDDRDRGLLDGGDEGVVHAQRADDHAVDEAALEAVDEVDGRGDRVPGGHDDDAVAVRREDRVDRGEHLDVDGVTDVGDGEGDLEGALH